MNQTGTLYVSGIVDRVERNVRLWITKIGRPNHVVATVFERELHPEPWPHVWLGRELGTLYVEKMRQIYRDSSDSRERAAIGGLIPPEGRVPAIVEMTTRSLFGEPLPSLSTADLKAADEHDRTLLQKAKAGIVNVITATDEDEPEEAEE